MAKKRLSESLTGLSSCSTHCLGEVENLMGRIAQWGFLEFCDPHPALIGAFGTAGPWAEYALMHVQMNTSMGKQTCR